MYIIKILLLAGAYYLTGRLGLLLAIPPGFATAVWPPSGIALAGLLLLGYRYCPGIFLGSFLINAFIAFDLSSSEAIINSTLIAGGIALGAVLQAVASTYLIRRLVSFPNALEDTRDIVLILVLGGPVGCLINATLATLLLGSIGAIPWSGFGFSWFIWWAGDTLGVIAFATVTMLVFTRAVPISTQRKMVVTAPLLVAFLCVVFVLWIARETEERYLQAQIERQTTQLQQASEVSASTPRWNVWVVLAGGLLFVGLLSVFMLMVTAQMEIVQRLVQERTAELENANEQLKTHAAELERSNRELDEYAYAASHDLKSPLRAVDGLVKLIDKATRGLLSEDKHKYLDLMQHRVRRMEKLLDDLLAYARIGRTELKKERIDTGELIRDIRDLLDPPAGFTLVVPDDMPTLEGTAAPLEQTFANLIGNAVKHHDRPEGRIEISWKDLGERIEFSVADDGPGIPATLHEKVFGIFQTLKPRDTVEGSGMGLALVKKMVEYQGGTITLASDVGQGACFRFTWLKG